MRGRARGAQSNGTVDKEETAMADVAARRAGRLGAVAFAALLAADGGMVWSAGPAAAQRALPAPGRPDPAALEAPKGVTALSGRILDLEDKGLPNVELVVGGSKARTDEAGRFLLPYVTAGDVVLQIDGRNAGRNGRADHGYYQVRVSARAGVTTPLPFTSWLPRIDRKNDVEIASPTRSEVVVRNPDLPDLELRIPAGTVVRDVDGRIVRRVGITPIPADRTPFPFTPGLGAGTFFTIQPGAACLYTEKGGVAGAQIRYPNPKGELPGARGTVWHYEPDRNGWTPYGVATVGPDGRQFVPGPGVVITDFHSAECDPATRVRLEPPAREPKRQRGPNQ